MQRNGVTVEPLFIGDDAALDFINTAFGVGTERRETLDSDQSVLAWLEKASLSSVIDGTLEIGGNGALLRAALELREVARELIERRKRGAQGNPSALNRVLALSGLYQQLVWKRGQIPIVKSYRKPSTAEALLVPLAEAIAKLLARADFDLVRKCESSDCTLWFYDRTKSHHRRWCSMAMCGNRAKVAAYRARQREA